MGNLIGRSLLIVGLMIGAVASQADVIYDNGAPNGFVFGTSSYFTTILDDFELETGSSTITDFHWYGSYYEDVPAEDDFTLYIFDENDNLITTIDGADVTRTATGESTTTIFGGDFDEYYYELLVDPIALDPNTTYYLGIANSDDALWAWEYANGFTGDADLWFQNTDQFVDGFGDFSYQITGGAGTVVPEPATLSLLGLGIVGIALRRKFAR